MEEYEFRVRTSNSETPKNDVKKTKKEKKEKKEKKMRKERSSPSPQPTTKSPSPASLPPPNPPNSKKITIQYPPYTPLGVTLSTGSSTTLTVSRVQPYSYSSDSGVLVGDTVLECEGSKVEGLNELMSIMNERKGRGEGVRVRFERVMVEEDFGRKEERIRRMERNGEKTASQVRTERGAKRLVLRILY